MSEQVRGLVAEFRRLKAVSRELMAKVDAQLDPGPTVGIEAPSNVLGGVSFDVAFVFSKPVTGFDTSEVIVTNGGVADTRGHSRTERESFTFNIIPESTYRGVFHIVVPGGAARDRDGNPNQPAHRHVVVTS